MTWTAYQVSFRLLSSAHIGWRKLGNLQQTRPYLTGRTLWGALTSRLTREQNSSDYEGIGEEVDKQLAFTYFYPSTHSLAVKPWPWPAQQWDEFAWLYLGSYASTALENGHSAEAGSLHETEYIAQYTRNGDQVYLVGYIFEKEGCSLHWRSALIKLQIGGERSYGWGRVQLEKVRKLENEACFGYTLNCEGNRPLLIAPNDIQLLAHTIVSNTDMSENSLGRGVAIEPFLGRETRKGGFGASFPEPEICWVPGGKVNKDEIFEIQAKGILKKQYP
jgi:hypothetical protein